MPAFIVHKCPEFIEKLKDFPPTLKRSSFKPFLPRVGSDSYRVSAKKDFCETLNRFEIQFVSICLLQSMTLHEIRVKATQQSGYESIVREQNVAYEETVH